MYGVIMKRISKTGLLIGIVLFIAAGSIFLTGKFFGTKCSVNGIKRDDSIKIGYFHGGRTHLFWRAYSGNYFEKEGVKIKLYSKYFDKEGFYEFPKEFNEVEDESFSEDGERNYFGKVTGIRIIEAINEGILDGGTVGEASFLHCLSKGIPVVAVAKLGHESRSEPSKALVLRKDILIRTPEDFEGKVLASGKAGPIDAIMLKEFVESIGLRSDKDVTIIEQVPSYVQAQLFEKKQIDGALVHVHNYIKMKKKLCNLYRRLDWVDPEISHAMLIFRKDFVDNYPDKVEKIVRGYMKRIEFERNIPKEERLKEKRFGLQMEMHFDGIQLPVYDFPPLLDKSILEEIESLLLKYRYIDKRTDVEEFINNSFVEKIYRELKK